MLHFDPPSTSNRYNRDDEFSFTFTTQQRPPPGQHGLNLESKPNNNRLRYTDHTYHDFAAYIEDGGKIEKHKKFGKNFPARLHAMLSDEQHSHIISWMPHGRAWKVLNKDKFVDKVIPKYFGQSNYASFNRQLSGWGFKRLHQKGPDSGCYYHECFLRGHPRLTALMRRAPAGKGRATPNTDEEPDFYEIAEQYPLEKSAAVAAKAEALPGIESMMSNNQWQWDPYQHYSTLTPQPHHQFEAAAHAAAANRFDDVTANQPTKSQGQYQSSASAGVGTVAAKHEEGHDQTEPSARDVMNYDHFLLMSLQLHSHRGYSMHPALLHAAMDEYYSGSNVNQHTTEDSLHQSAARSVAGYHVSQLQHSQQQQHNAAQHIHEYYGYRSHYFSYYYNGQVPGQRQSPGLARRQGYIAAQRRDFFPPPPAQSYHNTLPRSARLMSYCDIEEDTSQEG